MADTQPLDQTASPASRPPSLKQNAVLAGRYELIRFIANGGMGEVWEANDRALNERVALKTIRADAINEEMLERFRREVKLARKVSHRNVCRVFEFGEHKAEDGRSVTFLTMELLTGTPLDAVLRQRGKLPPEEALQLLEQMALALDAAHAEGIVHRDFKTGNVFVVPTTTGNRVVVTDFGIARALSDDSRVTVDPSQMIGTPAYMAPEQVEGSTVGPAADLYALGVVAFELVTGQLPFNGPSAMAMALTRLREPARRLADVAPGIDGRWDAAVAHALARKPEERFPSASAFVAAMRGTGAPMLVPTPLPPPGRRRWAPIIAGIILAAMSSAIVWRGVQGHHDAVPAVTRGGVLHAATAVPGALIEPNMSVFSTPGVAAAHIYERLGEPGLLSRTTRGNDLLFRLAAPRTFHPHPCWAGGASRPATPDDLTRSLKQISQLPTLDGGPAVRVEGDAVVVAGQPEAILTLSMSIAVFQPALPADCSPEARTFPAGTGPFRLERTEGADRYELVRDDSNRPRGDQGPPYLDHISLIWAPSAVTVVPQLKSGELQVIEVPRSEWADFFVDPQDRHPKLRPPFDALPVKVATMEAVGTGVVLLSINADRPDSPVTDSRIRRAIAIGINRAEVAKLHERRLLPFGRLMPTGTAGAAPVVDEALEYRPDEARRLIASVPASVSAQPILLGYLPGYRQMLEEIARELQSEGLKVSTAEFSVGAASKPFDLYLNVATAMPDALSMLLSCGLGSELAPKSNSRLDRLVTLPYAARVREYADVERDLLTELRSIPLATTSPHSPSRIYLYRPEVKGFADEDTQEILETDALFMGVHLEPAGR